MKTSPSHCVRLAMLTVLLAVVAGCQGPLLTAAYMLGYGDTQAEFKGLKKKRVVVVCRPLVELQYRNMNAAKMISREIASQLRRNISGIEVVDNQKTDEWLDSNSFTQLTEIGQAFEADMVVGVDLVGFDVYEGQTLFRGKANYEIKVVDCNTGQIVFEKPSNTCVWPPNTGIPTSEKEESQFRRQFIGVLAEKIAHTFYRYDHRDSFAGDSLAFE